MNCAPFRRTAVRLARVSFLLMFAAVAAPPEAPAQWAVVRVMVAPPAMPYYEQPAMPSAGYIWTPGYWAWDRGDYYWVPGTWVEPPSAGLLWTPGYWLCRDNVYYWNEGYWGEHVGFYGGVNYGYGYNGSGYAGGYWNGGEFSYNSTVNNFGDVAVSNSYEQTVVDDNTTNVSYNGGAGGTAAMPTQVELAVARERHMPPTYEQGRHQVVASSDTQLRASANGGSPPIAATAHVARLYSGRVTGTLPAGHHRWPTMGQQRQPSWGGAAAGRIPGMGGTAGGMGGRPGMGGPGQQQTWGGGGMPGRNPGMGGPGQQQTWGGGMPGRNPGMGGPGQQQTWGGGVPGRNPGMGGPGQQQTWGGGMPGRNPGMGGSFPQSQQPWTSGTPGRMPGAGGSFQPQSSWGSGAGRGTWGQRGNSGRPAGSSGGGGSRQFSSPSSRGFHR